MPVDFVSANDSERESIISIKSQRDYVSCVIARRVFVTFLICGCERCVYVVRCC